MWRCLRTSIVRWLPRLVLLAACHHDVASPQDDPITGVYTLRTVGGQPLPYVHPVTGWQYVAGTIQLDEDTTFTDVIVIRLTHKDAPDTLRGRYEVTPDSIKFLAVNAMMHYAASRSGTHALDVLWDEGLFHYVK